MKKAPMRTVPCTVGRSLFWMASKARRPTPGMLKTVSVRIAPPSRMPEVEAEDGDDRRDGRAHAVLEDDGPLAQPLGARGPDVVLGHRLEQVAAQEARVDRGERGGEHEPRHDQRRYHLTGIGEDVAARRVGALALEERELAEVLGEEVERDEAEPVDRGRDRHERRAHRHAVHPRAALDGGDDPHRDPDQQPHDRGADRQRHGGGQAVEDLRLDRDVVLEAVAEVEVEDEPVQVLQVLDVPRLVEAERVADRRQQLR